LNGAISQFLARFLFFQDFFTSCQSPYISTLHSPQKPKRWSPLSANIFNFSRRDKRGYDVIKTT